MGTTVRPLYFRHDMKAISVVSGSNRLYHRKGSAPPAFISGRVSVSNQPKMGRCDRSPPPLNRMHRHHISVARSIASCSHLQRNIPIGTDRMNASSIAFAYSLMSSRVFHDVSMHHSTSKNRSLQIISPISHVITGVHRSRGDHLREDVFSEISMPRFSCHSVLSVGISSASICRMICAFHACSFSSKLTLLSKAISANGLARNGKTTSP